MNAYRPTVVPQTIVELAPTDAPRRTRVFSYIDRRTIWLRGLVMLVNTHDGPRNTSSPMITPVATWTFWPRMHFLPSLHFGMTWEKCQTLVPSPISHGSSM